MALFSLQNNTIRYIRAHRNNTYNRLTLSTINTYVPFVPLAGHKIPFHLMQLTSISHKVKRHHWWTTTKLYTSEIAKSSADHWIWLVSVEDLHRVALWFDYMITINLVCSILDIWTVALAQFKKEVSSFIASLASRNDYKTIKDIEVNSFILRCNPLFQSQQTWNPSRYTSCLHQLFVICQFQECSTLPNQSVQPPYGFYTHHLDRMMYVGNQQWICLAGT